MTWWDWLIVSIFAWVAADVLLVAFIGWRSPWHQTPRPNGLGHGRELGAELKR